MLVDPQVATRLEQGGSLIVPSARAAARLRLAWARHKVAAGQGVWESPDILTWEAWLAREWQRSLPVEHPAARLHVLNRTQEAHLWAQALHELEHEFADYAPLQRHGQALRRMAHRARQYLLEPPRTPLTVEEDLLWRALQRVEQLAGKRNALILGLAGPQRLAALCAAAPRFAGTSQLTPLQALLGRQLWPDDTLLLAPCELPPEPIEQWHVADAEAEMHALVRWCRARLDADPGCRLRIIQCRNDPPLEELAARLWRGLAQDAVEALQPWQDSGWLAVEAAQPLSGHPLVGQALALTGTLLGTTETTQLSHLFSGPWFDWGDEDPAPLELALRRLGRPNWTLPALLEALRALAPRQPAADQCVQRLQAAAAQLAATGDHSPGHWAGCFDRALAAAGFPGRREPAPYDTRGHMQWRALLDEFASLDVLELHLDAPAAWQELARLAGQSVHETDTQDVAITLTMDRSDPLVRHDGIWVLGMSEDVVPEPARPENFIDPDAQRRAGWPQASAALQLQQASEELSGWRRRAGRLVASCAALDGDLPCSPSRLLPSEAWQPLDLPPPAQPVPDPGIACERIHDARLPALAIAADQSLRQASSRLTLQQACPFRSQAQVRLGAARIEIPVEGIDPRLRGQLLHAALEGLWQELRDSQGLHARSSQELADTVVRHWEAAERRVLAATPCRPAARALARERRRGLSLIQQLMLREQDRDPFTVVAHERKLHAHIDGVGMELRIDRIDRLEDGRHLLIDYKTGQPEPVALDGPSAHPLQLALYAAALAAARQPVRALALVQLQPGKVCMRGVADAGPGLRGLGTLADWDAGMACWQEQVSQLLASHLAGDAAVTPEKGACRLCHLQALCRIGEQQSPAIDEDEDAPGDE